MTRLKRLMILGLMLLPLQGYATTFKIASIAPDGTSWMNEMRKGAKEIEKRTEGRVKFRFYPGGIMGNDKSVLRKIRVGQLHGGAITGGGLAEISPQTQVYTIPFLFHNYAEVDTIRKQFDPELIAGLKEKGFISFGISEGGFAYLFSTSSIAGIDDLDGHKVWVPEGDEISRAAFEASNVSPISLPLTDVLTGLQTGLIDTVAGSAIGAIALQWHTRVKYLTDSPLAYIYGTLVLKRRAFEQLSEADRNIVSEVMSGVFGKLNAQNRKDDASALQALRGQGITFVEPSAQETERWQHSVDTAMEKLMQQGLFDQTILNRIEAQLAALRKTAKP